MAKKNYEELGLQILEHVGGASNVSYLTHCVTRLRFNLKDKSTINQEAIKATPGIMGCQFSGNQFQIIIGPDVKQVYEVILPFIEGEGIAGVPQEKEKLTIKSAASKLITNFTSCIIPILPVIICAGMLKMIIAIFGPMVLNWIQADTGLFNILTFAGDAGFYFIPVFLGYTTAKHFKTNIFIGMLLGAILVHPSFVAMVTENKAMDFLGIPVTPAAYSYSVLPAVMSVWVMSYVRKMIDHIIPDSLKMILVDAITVIIMLPITFCLLGPLGSILSIYLNNALLAIYDIFGPFGIGLIGALFLFLILTGMHHAVNMAAIVALTTTGFDGVVFVGAAAATLSVIGANLAFVMKSKKSENRSLGITATVMQAVSGVVEPSLFGIFLPYKKIWLAQAIGAFCGGTLMGFLGCKMYVLTGSNVLILAGFLGADMNNFIYACIGCGLAIIVSFASVYLLRYQEK